MTFAPFVKRTMLSPEKSLLELSEEAGLNIDYECRSGVRGRCKTRLLSGCVTMEVHDALDESDKANNFILLCQAIREHMMRNEAGVAPSHADFQRFFNLTPPSVNSMLIRLEDREFIRRIPGRARAIELTINLDWIPPLDRPFRF